MEELDKFCRSGRPIILYHDWEQYDNAKKLLISNGYIEELDDDDIDDNKDKSIVSFVKKHTDAIDQEDTIFVFPAEALEPQYDDDSTRSSSPFDGEWMQCKPFQLDSMAKNYNPGKEPWPPEIRAKTGTILNDMEFDKIQQMALQFKIQPLVQRTRAQLSVKMRVDKLLVGVYKKDFINEEHQLGYYPHFISLSIEPIIEMQLNEAYVVVYEKDGQTIESEATALKDTRTMGGSIRLGFSPAVLTLNKEIIRERRAPDQKTTCVVPTHDEGRGSLANFEWCILRWPNGEPYNTTKPHKRFRYKLPSGKGPLKLPFEKGAAAANVRCIPEALWSFPSQVQESQIKFRVTLQVKMHFLWYKNFFSSGSKCIDDFQYVNDYELITGA